MSSISLLIPNLAIDEERFFEVIGKDFSWMTSREDWTLEAPGDEFVLFSE